MAMWFSPGIRATQLATVLEFWHVPTAFVRLVLATGRPYLIDNQRGHAS